MIPIHQRKKRLPKKPGVTVEIVESTSPPPLPKEEKTRNKIEQRDTFVSNGITWKRTDTGWSCYDPLWDINHSQLNFLVHSYLYYCLDISLISDSHYDNGCKWLYDKQKQYSEEFRKSEFYELCKDLDESGSGFYLREEDYPLKVKQVAVRLLNQNGKDIPEELEGVKAYERNEDTK